MGPGEADTLPADDGEVAPSETELPVVDPAVYELGAELARGGFGRLIRARDRRLDRFVAIKQLRATNAQLEARFRLEARLTARLAHPAIVPVHEVGRWPSGEPFYAMKLVTGRSLRERLDAASGLADRLALLPAVTTVADAVAHAHREKILHRDLKPGNIMIGDAGEAYVIDWGLAKDLRGEDVATPEARSADPSLTMAGAVLGTPPYLSPEQARGDAVDERADVYSLGALLYELVTGTAPYAGDVAGVLAAIAAGPPPAAAAREPAVPPELAAIIARAMARAAIDRYPTAGELTADLQRFARRELVSAYRYSIAQRAGRWVRRHRAAAIAALGAVAAAGATAAYFASRSHPAPWRPEIRELSSHEENGTFTVFSPDGKLLAFDSDRDGQRRIYVGAPPLDDARPITPPDLAARLPKFARDGRSVLFRGDDGMHRAPLDGGPSSLVAEGAHDITECGENLVLVRRRACSMCFGLVSRDKANHERALLDLPPGLAVGTLDCDRDGNRVAYTRFDYAKETTPEQSLWLYDLRSGAQKQLLGTDAHPRTVRFHPDGKSVLVSSDRAGPVNVWDVPIDGGAPTQVTFGAGPDVSPDISSDGTTLVFHVDVTSIPLFEVPLDGSPPRRLMTTLDDAGMPAVSPDGRFLAYARSRGAHVNIVLRSLATGEERSLGDGNWPRFDRSGQHVLLARNSDVMAVPIDPPGAAPRLLFRAPGEVVGLIQDLPDGYSLSVVGPDGAEALQRGVDGTFRRIAPAPYLGVATLPNGWKVGGMRDSFELVPPGGTLGDTVNPRVIGLAESWDSNAASLYFLVGDDDIWRYDFAARASQHVMRIHLARDFVPSPDGKVLYLTQKIGRVRRSLITNFGARPRPE
jgi:WD40 repeat protein